jgi:hypothetical protein
MALVLPALLCSASGLALVCLGWTRRAPLPSDLLLQTSMSVGFGLGIFSADFFVSRVFGVSNLLAVDLLVFTVLLVAFFLIRTLATPIRDHSQAKEKLEAPGWLHRILTVAFAIALCAALYAALMSMFAHPHGDGWDAFAIWNLHARFLFRGGPYWRDGFSPLIPWSHPDYPLLLPAATAHFWTYLGRDDPRVPAALGLLFTFSSVGLLFSALSILRGRTPALLGGLALLATPFFIEQGSSQYADVPLSFFFLATIALLSLQDHGSGDPSASRSPGLLVLAGLACGFAAWTKNEGLLFLCAVVLARLFILIRPRPRHGASPQTTQELPEIRPNAWIALAPLLAAIAPAFLLVLWLKHSFGPPRDLLSDPTTVLHKLLDPSRYWAVLKWYVKGFLRFGHWLLIPGTLLMIGVYFTVGGDDRRKSDPGFRSSVLALLLTLAGYFAVYLITPYDLYWHLRFSLMRLFLQLWPSTIFLFFLAVPCGAGTAARCR